MVLFIWDVEAYNKLELNKMVGEASGKLWFVQELEIWKIFLLFFVGPDKKQREIKIKYSQTHFESVLGYYTSYQKKNLSKSLSNWGNLVLQKGTKESKISLGSWLSVWAANKMCTFIAEYETLKYSKGNYLKSKLQIFIKMLAKRG